MPGSSGRGSAVVVVDVLNPYEHEDADALARTMRDAAGPIAGVLDRAREDRVPVVYVNDNYGHWNSSSAELMQIALAGRHPELVEPLRPPKDASFVIKARHSIFYGTPLEYLLRQLGVSRIVLCGQVTEQCILYSALDAYVRHFEVAVPSDGVAHIDAELADAALRMMRRNMRACVEPGSRLSFDASDAGPGGNRGDMSSDENRSVESVERAMQREAAQMERRLGDLDDRIEDAEQKARRNRDAAGQPADESLDAVASDAADRSTASDDPTSAVGNPTRAD